MLTRRDVRQDQTLPIEWRRVIDVARDRFESAWRTGNRPDLSTFLDHAGLSR